MCRPLLMLIICKRLASETDSSLFTYRCDLRSEEFDNVDVQVIKELGSADFTDRIKYLNRVLQYRNAKKSLGAFLDMVHRARSSVKKQIVHRILQYSFYGATRRTELATIMEAVDSGALLFMDISRGFVMKSLDDLNTLKDISNNIKFHQIAWIFPDHPIIVYDSADKRPASEDIEIDPSENLMNSIYSQELSYTDGRIELSDDYYIANHYVDDRAIYKYLFNTIYQNGKECMGLAVAEIKTIELVSKWSLEPDDNDERVIQAYEKALETQFKVMVTTKSFLTYTDVGTEDTALDLFLVYLQTVDRAGDFSFLTTIKFLEFPVENKKPISFVYKRKSMVYRITKIRSERALHISFSSRCKTKDTRFNINRWYTETLKKICGNNHELCKKYTGQPDLVVKRLHDGNDVRHESLFKDSGYMQHTFITPKIYPKDSCVFVMLYSGEMTNIHDELFYIISTKYGRDSLDRFVTQSTDERRLRTFASVPPMNGNTLKLTVNYDDIKTAISRLANSPDVYSLLHVQDKNIAFYCVGIKHANDRTIQMSDVRSALK
jgi:hypothetical protein